MNNNLHFSTGENDVETPEVFFIEWDREAHAATGQNFVWDVAAVQGNRKCENYFGPDHRKPEWRNCLTIDWPTYGPLWMNPPYGKPEYPCKPNCQKKSCPKRGFHLTEYSPGCIDFVRKAVEQAKLGRDVWALLAARTDNEWWHECVWKRWNQWHPWVNQVHFIKGRLKFVGQKDSAPFPSVVVRFKV